MLLDVAQRAAPDRHRLLSPAPAAHVAGGADDGQPGLGREGARLQHHRGEQALRGGHRLPGCARPVGHALPGGAAGRAHPLRGRGAARRPGHPLPAHRDRGQRGGPRRGQGRLRPPARLGARAVREERRPLPHAAGAHARRGHARRPARHRLRLGQGGRRQGPGRQPAAGHRPGGRLSERPARASARASPGTSGATRSGPRSPSTPTATSSSAAPRSSSCASSSARTARSPTRSRRARRSSPGSRTTSTRGRRRTPRRSTWSRRRSTGGPRATRPTCGPPGSRS